MKLPEWLLQDGDNLLLLLDEMKLLLNKYRCGSNRYCCICYNCKEYGLSSLKRLVTRSLREPKFSLEVNLGIEYDVEPKERINLRIKWLEQLEAKLLELKGK